MMSLVVDIFLRYKSYQLQRMMHEVKVWSSKLKLTIQVLSLNWLKAIINTNPVLTTNVHIFIHANLHKEKRSYVEV